MAQPGLGCVADSAYTECWSMREFWQRVQELMRLMWIEPPSS
jgi:hypothetical protein